MTRHSRHGYALHLAVSLMLVPAVSLSAQQSPCGNDGVVRALVRAYVLSSLLFESRHFPPPETIQAFVAGRPHLFGAGAPAVACARTLSTRLLGAAVSSYDSDAYEDAVNGGAGEFAHDVASSINRPSLELMEMGFDMLWLSDVLPDLARGDPTLYMTTGTPTRLQGKQLLPIWDALLDDPSNGPMLAQLRAQLEAIVAQAEINVLASVARMR
jgi:hypothetical protein